MCIRDSSKIPPGGVFTKANTKSWFLCPTGTTAAAVPSPSNINAANTYQNTFCEGIVAKYYGTAGDVASAHAVVSACTATFSGANPPGIASDASTSTTTKTACKTAPGYIITSNADVADGAITVAAAAAGKKAAGGTALVSANQANKGTATETATTCAAGKYSAAGAASCTNCAAGTYSAAGASACTTLSLIHI